MENEEIEAGNIRKFSEKFGYKGSQFCLQTEKKD